ncbi:hypothetical protein L6R52_00580 [Myxococcota bacterium]|nr:hypothetical protein [Myxococcota bacterium]
MRPAFAKTPRDLRRVLRVLAFAVAPLLGGCIIVDDDAGTPGPVPGHVDVRWTITGRTCADVPGVAQVRVTIPGEVLVNDGLFPCSTDGVDGVVLHDFVPGSYTLAVDASDESAQVSYRAEASFSVNGDVTVQLDLAEVAR